MTYLSKKRSGVDAQPKLSTPHETTNFIKHKVVPIIIAENKAIQMETSDTTTRCSSKTSIYRGVGKYKKGYRVRVYYRCKIYYLGIYTSEVVALLVYDDFIIKHKIKGRKLNFTGTVL